MKRISLNGLKNVLSQKEMKNVLGGCGGDTCLKCQGYGGCAFYLIPPGTDCWSIGDVGCVYGFACGPCSNLSPC